MLEYKKCCKRREAHQKTLTVWMETQSWLQSRVTHTMAWLWAPATPRDKLLWLGTVRVRGML